MEARRYRHVIHTLAFSLLVVCLTNQFGALAMDELGKLIAFLILAGLILFVINRSSALRRIIASGLIGFASILRALVTWHTFIRRTSTVSSVPNVSLPFRFQRPPPIFSR